MLIYYFSYDVNKYQHLCPPKLLVQFLNVYWWKEGEKKATTSMEGVCVCACARAWGELIHAHRGEYKCFMVYFTKGRHRGFIIYYQNNDHYSTPLCCTTRQDCRMDLEIHCRKYTGRERWPSGPYNRKASHNAGSFLQNSVPPVVTSQVEVLCIYSLKL